MQRAHDLVSAPHVFGIEIGFNLPAFLHRACDHGDPGDRDSRRARRSTRSIVIVKVAVVLFVIMLGMHYVNRANWGHDWSTFAPMGFSGIGAGAAYIFFAYIGFDAVSTTAQEAQESAAGPSHRHHRFSAGLHGSVHSGGLRF